MHSRHRCAITHVRRGDCTSKCKREVALWIVVSGSFFSYDTQKALFVQNYPTRAYKDAIELAGRRLNSRHVFGIERLQNRYDTIYLQLGFTKLGFTSRLPEWLVGHTSTLAIQHLEPPPIWTLLANSPGLIA